MDDIKLPPLQVAELDRSMAERLFDDVASLGEQIEASVKGAASLRASGAGSLGQARGLLLSGAAAAVQIRYRHGGASWCDTLMATGSSFRLVRIKAEDVAASVSSAGSGGDQR